VTIQEDRIHDDTRDSATAYLACEVGLVVVELAGAHVGRFRVERRRRARDVAADGTVAVATDRDVLLAESAGNGDETTGQTDTDDGYRSTGFGPAVAVGVDADAVVAASPDRGIYRLLDEEWFQLARIDHDVVAIDGPLIAAEDGVYRATPDGLDHVGLSDVRDVAARGPYAATGDGLYELGNGWMRASEGAFDVVDCSRDRERSHAGAGAELFARRDGAWTRTDAPGEEPIAGVGYAYGESECTYAVTDAGTILAREPGDGVGAGSWRTRNVGVQEVHGMAVR
jgi:hypothetical protein